MFNTSTGIYWLQETSSGYWPLEAEAYYEFKELNKNLAEEAIRLAKETWPEYETPQHVC